jgi:ribosomal protein S18 acetylase RimI-like enzyme
MRDALMAHLRGCNALFPESSEQARGDYPARCRQKIDWDGCLFLVAEQEGGALVGMGEIHLIDQPGVIPAQAAKINDVWVDPGHRRCGLATAMAQLLLVFAVSREIGSVWLDWVDGNREAEGLWRTLGFAPVVVRAGIAGAEQVLGL